MDGDGVPETEGNRKGVVRGDFGTSIVTRGKPALEIIWDYSQFLNLAALYLAFFVPFFFAASCIGLVFTCRGSESGRIYFFDFFTFPLL